MFIRLATGLPPEGQNFVLSNLLNSCFMNELLPVEAAVLFSLFLKKSAKPGLFFIYFQSFYSINTILQQINVKYFYSVSSAKIQTHDSLIMSLLPQPPASFSINFVFSIQYS